MLFSVEGDHDSQIEIWTVDEEDQDGQLEATFSFPETTSDLRLQSNDVPTPMPIPSVPPSFRPDTLRHFFRISFRFNRPNGSMPPEGSMSRCMFIRRSTFLKAFNGYGRGDQIPFSVWGNGCVITEIDNTFDNEFECFLQAGRYASVTDSNLHVWDFVAPRANYWAPDDKESAGSIGVVGAPELELLDADPVPHTISEDTIAAMSSNKTYHTASCPLDKFGVTQAQLYGILVDDERIILVKVPLHDLINLTFRWSNHASRLFLTVELGIARGWSRGTDFLSFKTFDLEISLTGCGAIYFASVDQHKYIAMCRHVPGENEAYARGIFATDHWEKGREGIAMVFCSYRSTKP